MTLQIFHIHLCPNAKRDEVCGMFGDRIKIAISAPAVDGKANEALIKFLSKHIGVAKSDISIVKGLTSRDKTISIETDKKIVL